MEILDTARIFLFHKNLVKEFGEGTKESLGWKSPAGQLARFEVLSEIGNLNDRSVLDAGCGHGDLREFLGNRYPHIRYFGVEQIPAILKVAVDRYSHLPETLFFQGDFFESELPAVDYILACGSLSYRHSDTQSIFKQIEKLFHSCRIGLGFNLLSKIEPEGGLLVAYDPATITSFCKTLTTDIVLKKNYYEDDFTIFMYH